LFQEEICSDDKKFSIALLKIISHFPEDGDCRPLPHAVLLQNPVQYYHPPAPSSYEWLHISFKFVDSNGEVLLRHIQDLRYCNLWLILQGM
jgi:hypothetical protein